MSRPAASKRPPWLSSEDAEMLMGLPIDARREMGNLLHQQAREQQRYRTMIVASDLAALERLQGERTARPYGTGGGRAKRVLPADPS